MVIVSREIESSVAATAAAVGTEIFACASAARVLSKE